MSQDTSQMTSLGLDVVERQCDTQDGGCETSEENVAGGFTTKEQRSQDLVHMYLERDALNGRRGFNNDRCNVYSIN